MSVREDDHGDNRLDTLTTRKSSKAYNNDGQVFTSRKSIDVDSLIPRKSIDMDTLTPRKSIDVDTLTPRKAYDVLYKVLVIGESTVGKTALITKYQDPDRPLPNLISTLGIDYRSIDLPIDGLRVRVQLWDTVGQERFRTMTKNFFRGAKGVLLLFDVTNRETFIRVENWVNSLKTNDLDREVIFMIGNKIDLRDREVDYEEGRLLAAGYGMKYFETSAKTGENVTQTIEELVYNIKDMNNLFQTSSRKSITGNKWAELYDGLDDGDNTTAGGGGSVGGTIRLKPLTRRQKLQSRCCQGRRTSFFDGGMKKNEKEEEN